METINVSVKSAEKAGLALRLGGRLVRTYNTVRNGDVEVYEIPCDPVRTVLPAEPDWSALVEYKTTSGQLFVAGQAGPHDLDTFRVQADYLDWMKVNEQMVWLFRTYPGNDRPDAMSICLTPESWIDQHPEYNCGNWASRPALPGETPSQAIRRLTYVREFDGKTWFK